VRYLLKPNTGLVVNFPEVVTRVDEETKQVIVIFAPKTPFSPAVAAGLIPYRDRIVRVNNRIIRSTRDLLEADLEIKTFDPFPVVIIRDGTDELGITITPSFSLTGFGWFPILLFSLILAFISFYLIFHLDEEQASIWIVLSCLCYIVFTCVKPFYYENMLSNSLIHLGKFTAWFLVLLALYFPRPRGKKAVRTTCIVVLFLLYILFVILRLRLYFHWMTGGEEVFLSSYRTLGKINNIAEGLAYVIFIFLMATAYVKAPKGEEKRQIEWLLAGSLVAFPTYFFFDQLPFIAGEALSLRISTGHFANLFLLIFPLFYIFGLIKKKRLDFNFFLSRYLVVIFLVSIICLFFGLLYNPLMDFMSSTFGLNNRIGSQLATLLLFLTLFPIRFFAARLGDRFFFSIRRPNAQGDLLVLKRENRRLQYLIDESRSEQDCRSQNEKIYDLKMIGEGTKKRLGQITIQMSQNLLDAQHRLNTSTSIKDAVSEKESENISEIISSLMTSNRELKDFVSGLDLLRELRPSLPVNADLALLIKTAVSRFKSKARVKDVTSNIAQDGKMPVYVDPEDIIKSLIRILINADENQDTEWICLDAYADNRHFCIDISNNGSDIGGSISRQAFIPYFTTRNNHQGMGLYLCKIAVERNRGTIEFVDIKSSPICVRIKLPKTL
jgi:signal transduction histidine kinase